MSGFTAQDRLARLLAVIPWVAARPDGATVAEIEQRFDYPRRSLLKDLEEVLFFVGVPPYAPGDLIEVTVEEGRVRIGYADWFARPLRLSAEERLRLVAAAKAVLAFDPDYGDAAAGGDAGEREAPEDGPPPLVRALAKLTASSDAALEIHLGDVPRKVREAVEEALRSRRTLELDYYSYGRDERTTRVVEPHRLFSDVGEWYLTAHCRRAGADRVFRVDRILRATVLDEPAPEPPAVAAGEATFGPGPDAPRVVLDLAPEAAWVLEQYPYDTVDARPDGTARVRLPAASRPFLERLLLRLGHHARVVEADGAGGADVVPVAAARILERYEDPAARPRSARANG